MKNTEEKIVKMNFRYWLQTRIIMIRRIFTHKHLILLSMTREQYAAFIGIMDALERNDATDQMHHARKFNVTMTYAGTNKFSVLCIIKMLAVVHDGDDMLLEKIRLQAIKDEWDEKNEIARSGSV